MEVSVNQIHKNHYIFIILHITILYEIFTIGGVMKSMIAYIKLPLIHCYHIFSNSTDVYLPKNYHEQYSLIWYRPTMLVHGLCDLWQNHSLDEWGCEGKRPTGLSMIPTPLESGRS